MREGQRDRKEYLVPHLSSGCPHAPKSRTTHRTSPQVYRAFSCCPSPPPKGSLIPSKSTENRPAGKTVTFVGSISGRFFGGGGKLVTRVRTVSITPLKCGYCEIAQVRVERHQTVDAAIPPARARSRAGAPWYCRR